MPTQPRARAECTIQDNTKVLMAHSHWTQCTVAETLIHPAPERITRASRFTTRMTPPSTRLQTKAPFPVRQLPPHSIHKLRQAAVDLTPRIAIAIATHATAATANPTDTAGLNKPPRRSVMTTLTARGLTWTGSCECSWQSPCLIWTLHALLVTAFALLFLLLLLDPPSMDKTVLENSKLQVCITSHARPGLLLDFSSWTWISLVAWDYSYDLH